MLFSCWHYSTQYLFCWRVRIFLQRVVVNETVAASLRFGSFLDENLDKVFFATRRFILKQLDYSFSICMPKTRVELTPRHLARKGKSRAHNVIVKLKSNSICLCQMKMRCWNHKHMHKHRLPSFSFYWGDIDWKLRQLSIRNTHMLIFTPICKSEDVWRCMKIIDNTTLRITFSPPLSLFGSAIRHSFWREWPLLIKQLQDLQTCTIKNN